MIQTLPALILLHAGCAVLYGALAALVLMRRSPSRTAIWLAGACLVTAAWAGAVALTAWNNPTSGAAGWLEIARSAAWYGFILHLYRRAVAVHSQLRQVFTTMGLLALLLVGGLPLIDVLSSQPDATLWSAGTAIRLGFAVCNILLLENLYLNTPSDARWHINLLCVALAGLFLYDLVLYADAALFHRVSQTLFIGRASGPCGTVATTARRRLFPISPRHGVWRLQFDTNRVYRRADPAMLFYTLSATVSGAPDSPPQGLG